MTYRYREIDTDPKLTFSQGHTKSIATNGVILKEISKLDEPVSTTKDKRTTYRWIGEAVTCSPQNPTPGE